MRIIIIVDYVIKYLLTIELESKISSLRMGKITGFSELHWVHQLDMIGTNVQVCLTR